MPAKKKATAKKKSTSGKGKSAARKPASRKKAAAKAGPSARSAAKPGDVILIESEKVGSPPREGEVLEILQGQISVSYRVRWQDGHESVIAPGAGNTRIVPSQRTR